MHAILLPRIDLLAGDLRRRWGELASSIDHDAIIASVDDDASLRASYLFMCVMASGIATTGLLVNSPAVIIGAMLISPLMAPIMRLGLGVGTLDHIRARQALQVLAAGMACALLTAMAIVWLSPIRELTTEIASRTRPSLFDLVVAVLSGLAGGYAMVRGRGGAIVGVAIATALMPPMAVVGYGLASGEWRVARGASLLFTTNLVAIALSVTAISTWYGFSRRRVRHALVWQTGLAFFLVLPLAYPLLQSLRAIAHEAQVTRAIRGDVARVLGPSASRVLSLQVASGDDGQISHVELTLAARHYSQRDDQLLRRAIEQDVGTAVQLRLSPIIEADPEHALLVEAALASAARQARLPVVPTPLPADPAEILLQHFPVRLLGHELDVPGRSMRLLIASGELDLEASRQMELDLRLRFPGWSVQVIPPAQGLPAIPFGDGSRALDAAATRQLDLAEWALKAWGVDQVLANGYASGGGRVNARLAGLRAQAVAERLQQDGIAARAAAVVVTAGQRKQELELGRAAYRMVLLSPAAAEPAPRPLSASGAAANGAAR